MYVCPAGTLPSCYGALPTAEAESRPFWSAARLHALRSLALHISYGSILRLFSLVIDSSKLFLPKYDLNLSISSKSKIIDSFLPRSFAEVKGLEKCI